MRDVHGGDLEAWAQKAGCRPEALVDASICLNPLGPPAWALDAARENLERVGRYPAPQPDALRERIAAWHGVPPASVLVADGTTSLIWQLAAEAARRAVVIFEPGFSEYEHAAAAHGCAISRRPLDDLGLPLPDDAALALVCNPNSPSGRSLRLDPPTGGCTWVIDEAYLSLCAGPGCPASLDQRAAVNAGVLVLSSITKLLAAPALRVGYLIGEADRVAALDRRLPPWRIGGPALAFAEAAFADRQRLEGHVAASLALISQLHERLTCALQALPGVNVWSGDAALPWVLAELDPARGSIGQLQARLAREHRILIRDASTMPGLDGRPVFRIGLKPPDKLERVIAALQAILSTPS